MRVRTGMLRGYPVGIELTELEANMERMKLTQRKNK